MSGSLCHPWGALNIPSERVLTVSEWKCGETGGHTRSAVFLVVFNVVLAVGNRLVFKGPDDLNGNGYFYARLCWAGVGLQANIDEEYVLLSALLRFFCWFEASVRPEIVRPGPPSLQQRTSRFRVTEGDLHEVLLS